MIELIEGFPENVLAVSCKGQVTKGDYEQILIPAVEKALQRRDKIRLYYRIGPEFEGIAPSAVLEDVKVGFSHLTRWERIALVTDIEWIRLSMRSFAFLLPCPIKCFALDAESQARQWISAA